MKPLVLHVAAFSNPAGGGFVSALQGLAKRSEFRTALLCPRASESYAWAHALRASGVDVIHASTALDVAAAVARSGPDVVHAHFVDWMLPATLGATAAHARTAWHLHSAVTPSRGPRSLARRLKYASAKRLVERFFCVAPDIVEYLRQHGVRPDAIVELPNGVDLEHFRSPTLVERAAARRLFHLAPHDRAIAFFGRDAAVKGADLLASALRLTHEKPQVLAIAASPASLQALGDERIVSTGTLSDVRDALWAADALALPSRAEGIAYSLLEARACGLPAVASALPGVLRALGSDPATLAVDSGDAVALAHALDCALALGPVPLLPATAAAISLDHWVEELAAWYVTDLAA